MNLLAVLHGRKFHYDVVIYLHAAYYCGLLRTATRILSLYRNLLLQGDRAVEVKGTFLN